MSSQEPSEQALQSLAQLFDEALKDPQSRKQFYADPGMSLAPGLPKSVADLFHDLSYEELRLLARTYEAMQQGNMTYDVGGVKVSFL